MAVNVVPSPVLDTRNGDQVAAEAIAALPPELSDRSDSNPAVALIEAQASVYDKLLYQINALPRAVIQLILSICKITLNPARPATVTQSFTLSNPQSADTSIPAGTNVSTTDGNIVFSTLADITVAAYALQTGTVATTSGSATVTGTGTAFVTGSTWVGYQIQIPANTGTWYTISSVSSTTSLILTASALATTSGVTCNVGPVSGSGTAQATTSGAKTNVGAGKLTTLASSPAGVASTTNAAAATGGTDEETISEARARAASEFAARDVACSDDDYADFAAKVLGGNGRTRARGGYNGTTATSGYVSVALLSPSWTTSSPVTTAERAAVARDLSTRSQTGVTVVDLAANIESLTGSGSTPAALVYRKNQYDESSVRISVAQKINALYSPNTYTWGRDRYVADLAERVESGTGVDRILTINGVVAVGTDYRTSAASMTFTNGSATVSAVGGTDHGQITANQTFLIDSTNKVGYLVTAKPTGTTLTLSSTWAGTTGAASAVPFFTSIDVAATNYYTLYYAALGTTASALPASIVVVGSVA